MSDLAKSTWIRAMSAFETLWEIMPEKLPSHLRGIVGEVMVWLKLDENDIDFTPRGGQFAYDIELANGKRVEVRTSMSTIHKPTKTKKWGWQVQKRSKKEKDGVNYDFLICATGSTSWVKS